MKITFWRFLALGLILPLAFSAGYSQQNIRIKKQLVSSGGMVGARSGNIVMNGSVGQAVIEKRVPTQGGGLQANLYQGFWTPILSTTGVNDPKAQEFNLKNFPNPFATSTTINYENPAPAFVSIKVFDLNGSTVASLFEGYQGAGSQNLLWEGKLQNGANLSNGSYYLEVSVRPVSGSDYAPYNMRAVMIINR